MSQKTLEDLMDEDEQEEIPSFVLNQTAEEIAGVTKALENEIRFMKNEIQTLRHEKEYVTPPASP